MSKEHSLINYVELSKLLHQLQFPMTVAEIHGLITGLIIGEKDDAKRMTLLYELTNEGESFSHLLREAVIRISDYTSQTLSSDDLLFELLLPDESFRVFERLDALAEWVNHFLLGLGVTRVDVATLDDESKEIFNDLREIAKLGYELDEDELTLESDLENVLEYIKASVLIYYYKFNTKKENRKEVKAKFESPLMTANNKTLH